MTPHDLYAAELAALVPLYADLERYILDAAPLAHHDEVVAALSNGLALAARHRALVLLTIDRLGQTVDPDPDPTHYSGAIDANPLPAGQDIQLIADLQRAIMLIYGSLANTYNLAAALDDPPADGLAEALGELDDLFEANDRLHGRLCRRAVGR